MADKYQQCADDIRRNIDKEMLEGMDFYHVQYTCIVCRNNKFGLLVTDTPPPSFIKECPWCKKLVKHVVEVMKKL